MKGCLFLCNSMSPFSRKKVYGGETAIGTAITLWQASKVRRYRQQIAFDLRKIHLSEVRELLRGAQDEGRKLLSHVQQLNRGKSVLAITDNIQAYIDRSLNLLHLSGPD